MVTVDEADISVAAIFARKLNRPLPEKKLRPSQPSKEFLAQKDGSRGNAWTGSQINHSKLIIVRYFSYP